MKSSIWFRPLASSSAVLAGIGALVVAAPLTAQGNSIAKSVSSPAYALLSHDGAYDNENGNDNDNDGYNDNDDNYANGTHVEDDNYANGTHVENDNYTNGTHVDDNGTHVENTGTHVDDNSNSSGGNFAGFVTEIQTRSQSQVLAQPRLKWRTGGNTTTPAPIRVTVAQPPVAAPVLPQVRPSTIPSGTDAVESAKPAKAAETETSSAVYRASESASAQTNGTTSHTKVRTGRSSEKRS